MGFIAIYITNSSQEAAQKLVAHLLAKKMVACANIFPITSAYWWQGHIENEQEWVALVKTRTANWEAVQSEVEKEHPYDVPCIMKIAVTANAAYEAWIEKATNIF